MPKGAELILELGRSDFRLCPLGPEVRHLPTPGSCAHRALRFLKRMAAEKLKKKLLACSGVRLVRELVPSAPVAKAHTVLKDHSHNEDSKGCFFGRPDYSPGRVASTRSGLFCT